ncbi:MAG TPA: exosortase H-associated membrane protein [Casimicrobiaceae bacterium]|jgi:hypothetical protein|nr:exosortase H-associated membrane protein [Casimicrobiaceae bacterium]
MRGTSLGRFVLRVAAWLPPAFAVWYVAGPVLAWPIGLLTEGVLKLGFADLVAQVRQQGHLLTVVSTLKPALTTTGDLKSGVLSVDLNPLLYSFGWPMLAALILAARAPRALRRLALGYVVLTPFVTWGLVAEFLKQLVFDAGPAVAAQTGFDALQREAIAFAYQFGSLILPTVAPAVFWVLTHRALLESFALRNGGAAKQAP